MKKKLLKNMTLEELKEEAKPILAKEQRQEKINRDKFLSELGILKRSS